MDSSAPTQDAGPAREDTSLSPARAVRAAAPARARLGRFEVLGELGRGGMGTVLRARDAALDREVAVKLLSRRGSVALRQRFLREARAAARLRHPGIVSVHEVGAAAGTDFLVMDLVDGEAVDALLRRAGPLSPRRAVEVARSVAEALAHAHAAGVIHRDVKPANVLLTRDGTVLLTDFGVAHQVDASRITDTGMILGTPAYMPPEQLNGRVDGRADVYSLGATLFELLTGEPPFTEPNIVNLMVQITSAPPAAPSTLAAGVDPGLDAICLRCLAKRPDERYPTPTALAADLSRWLEGQAVSASADRRLAARRRAGRGGAVVALGLALLLGGGGLLAARADHAAPATLERLLEQASPSGRSLRSDEVAAALAAASAERARLERRVGGERPAWLADAAARVEALEALVARARGGRPGPLSGEAGLGAPEVVAARALEALDRPASDTRAAADEVGRAIAARVDSPELHAWRAALLLASPAVTAADARQALQGLEAATRGGRADLATASLRGLALLAAGRVEAAAALLDADAEPRVRALVAVARARARLERGLVDEALTLTDDVRWEGPVPAVAVALADDAVRRAERVAARLTDDGAAAAGIALLRLARRVDPARATPAPLADALTRHVTAYQRASASIDLALDLAEAAPDLLEVQRAVGALELLTEGPQQRARMLVVLQRLRTLDPGAAEGALSLADLLHDLGRAGEAAAVLDDLGDDPLPDSRLEGRRQFQLARGDLAAQRIEAGVSRLRAILAAHGDDPGVLRNLLQALDRLGQGPEVVAVARRSLAYGAPSPLPSQLGARAADMLWKYREHAAPDEVRAALESVVRGGGGGWPSRAQLGLRLLERDEVEAAASHLRRVAAAATISDDLRAEVLALLASTDRTDGEVVVDRARVERLAAAVVDRSRHGWQD